MRRLCLPRHYRRRVLGQFDFTHDLANLVDGKGLYLPQAVAIDSSATPNRIYVADQDNNRVLGWRNADSFSNGAPAGLVIGQPDFISSGCSAASAHSLCQPAGVAVDGAGNLYVADAGNNRVLEYTNPFAACGSTLPMRGRSGQPGLWPGRKLHLEACNIDTGNGGSTAIDLCDPTGVAVDAAGNLYVADAGNNRVLEYNTPLTTDVTADTGLWPGRRLHRRITAISTPATAAPPPTTCAIRQESRWTASGNLYVADNDNSRVLEYNTPLTTDVTADMVFGQGGDFTSNDCDYDTFDGSSTAIDLCGPSGVAVDASGKPVCGGSGQRAGAGVQHTADHRRHGGHGLRPGRGLHLGCSVQLRQLSFRQRPTQLPTTCAIQPGVALDGAGNLYVADQGNNRVLEYNTPLSSGTTAERVLGQDDFAHNVANLVDARGCTSLKRWRSMRAPRQIEFTLPMKTTTGCWAGEMRPRSPTALRPTW